MVAASTGRRSFRRRFRWVVTICLVLLLACVVAVSLAQLHPTQVYLVAASAIPQGVVLSNDNLTTRSLDPGSVPPGAVLDGDRSSILAQVVIIPFAAGDIITTAHLGQGSGHIAGGVPPDMRLLKLSTNGIEMPDGLQPGDKIDMILSLQDGAGGLWTEDAIEGLTIQAMAGDGSSITLMVPPSVAVLIVHAAAVGKIVILAAPADEQPVVVPPVTTTGPCQIFIGPNGQPVLPSPAATPCPGAPGGTQPPGPSPTPTP